MKTYCCIIIFLLLLFFLPAAAKENGKFEISIQHPPDKRELAIYTKKVIIRTLPKYKEIFNFYDADVDFVLVDKADDYKKYVGYNMPSWTNGVTIFPGGKVVLKTPDLTKTSLREFSSTIRHELFHSMHGHNVPLSLTPAWFNEGLAVYFTETLGIRSRVILSRAIANDKLIPITELSGFLHFKQSAANLAYAESCSIIEFIVQVYGRDALKEIFDNLRAKMTFPESVSKVLKINYEDLPFFWERFVGAKYRWLFLLDIQNYLWLIMPVLALLAYLGVQLRNRKIEKGWENAGVNDSEDKLVED